MILTLKPGDEWFIGPGTDKRQAYAHVGMKDHVLIVIDAPYYTDGPTPEFDYGQGVAYVPVEAKNTGRTFQSNCWGVHSQQMFTICAIDEEAQEVTLSVEDGLVAIPRAEDDHALAAYHEEA